MLLRAALEQKKTEEQKEFGAIDYDAPVESEKKTTIGLGTKVGALQLQNIQQNTFIQKKFR